MVAKTKTMVWFLAIFARGFLGPNVRYEMVINLFTLLRSVLIHTKIINIIQNVKIHNE